MYSKPNEEFHCLNALSLKLPVGFGQLLLHLVIQLLTEVIGYLTYATTASLV